MEKRYDENQERTLKNLKIEYQDDENLIQNEKPENAGIAYYVLLQSFRADLHITALFCERNYADQRKWETKARSARYAASLELRL